WRFSKALTAIPCGDFVTQIEDDGEHTHMIQQPALTKDQYRDLSRQIVHSIETQFRIIPLNSLKHPTYRLKSPVHITLEFEKGQVIAGLDDIEAFACADTTSEAIDQLCEEIVQLYEDLMEDKENLAYLPEKWLRFLEEKIECS
ncbi:MAG: hypothetical protein AB7S77_15095, partial [Desulfatirhabdiaceae bacterium]